MTLTDNDDYGQYGDPETDPDAAMLDHALRELLTTFPEPETGVGVPADAAAQIHEAVQLAWPEGHPPTPSELAAEDSGHDPYHDSDVDSSLGAEQHTTDHGAHFGDHTTDHGVHFGDHTDALSDHPDLGQHPDHHSDGFI
jgi:hypothetical protein